MAECGQQKWSRVVSREHHRARHSLRPALRRTTTKLGRKVVNDKNSARICELAWVGVWDAEETLNMVKFSHGMNGKAKEL